MTKINDFFKKSPLGQSRRFFQQSDPFKATSNSVFNGSSQNATKRDFSPAYTQQGKSTSHTSKTPNNALTGENRQQTTRTHQQNQHLRFDTDNKPDPASFYARYGITLKGKQTNVKCCFHGDKTPSLSINSDTGAFYCFGCGASGGDVLDFYQRYHGCDFITACTELELMAR